MKGNDADNLQPATSVASTGIGRGRNKNASEGGGGGSEEPVSGGRAKGAGSTRVPVVSRLRMKEMAQAGTSRPQP